MFGWLWLEEVAGLCKSIGIYNNAQRVSKNDAPQKYFCGRLCYIYLYYGIDLLNIRCKLLLCADKVCEMYFLWQVWLLC